MYILFLLAAILVLYAIVAVFSVIAEPLGKIIGYSIGYPLGYSIRFINYLKDDRNKGKVFILIGLIALAVIFPPILVIYIIVIGLYFLNK